MNYYDILGLTPPSSADEIRRAYKKTLLLHHPDKHQTQSGTQPKLSIDVINLAYKTLKEDKQQYDKDLRFGDGLDIFNLSDFALKPVETSTIDHDDDELFVMKCPRCRVENGMQLTNDDLINGAQSDLHHYEVIVQCSDCSLWIRVEYEEEE